MHNPKTQLISTMVMEATFLQKKNATCEQFNTDQMAVSFMEQFTKQCFTVGQPIVFKFQDKKALSLTIKEIEGKIGPGFVI